MAAEQPTEHSARRLTDQDSEEMRQRRGSTVNQCNDLFINPSSCRPYPYTLTINKIGSTKQDAQALNLGIGYVVGLQYRALC